MTNHLAHIIDHSTEDSYWGHIDINQTSFFLFWMDKNICSQTSLLIEVDDNVYNFNHDLIVTIDNQSVMKHYDLMIEIMK